MGNTECMLGVVLRVFLSADIIQLLQVTVFRYHTQVAWAHIVIS